MPTLPIIEKALLLLTLVFLPSLEAPKNIAVITYLLVWVIGRIRDRDWILRWDSWDTWMLMIVIASYASTVLGAFPSDKGPGGAHHVAAMGFVFIAARRNRYGERFLQTALAVAVIATLATLAYGYWGLLVTHRRTTIGLNSVGHVNHSAIYMGIIFAIAFAATTVERIDRRFRLAAMAAAAVLAISLFISAARGALIPTVLFIALWLAATPMSRAKRLAMALTTVASITLALITIPSIVEKTRGGLESNQISSFRVALARVSLVAALEHPVFGVGISNFGKITPERVDQWQSTGKTHFSQDQLFYAPHAHNLYANTLAEKGLAELIPLLRLLGGIGLALIRNRPRDSTPPFDRILWGSALGAWVMTSVGGLFNTTLHHEHALITLILIGLWSSRQPKAAGAGRP